MNNMCLRDFQPVNRWTESQTIDRWVGESRHEITDETTGTVYTYISPEKLRSTCFGLTLITPLYSAIALLQTLMRVLRVVSGYHFWKEERVSFQESLKDMGVDVLKIVAAPFVVVALEVAALYGLIISPNDGRKLYASIERFFCIKKEVILMHEFQPTWVFDNDDDLGLENLFRDEDAPEQLEAF